MEKSGELVGCFSALMQVVENQGVYRVLEKAPIQSKTVAGAACTFFAKACPQSYPQKMWITREAKSAQ